MTGDRRNRFPTRAWFRRRLDADPRRWVILIAALGGPCALSLDATDRPTLLQGPFSGIWLLLLVLMPATSLMGMLVHGRLLWWTGTLLGGCSRPADIHAAFAWSTLPSVILAAPLLPYVPLHLIAQWVEPGSSSLERTLRIVDAVSGPLAVVAAIAALFSAVLYVGFLGEAQGFRAWRALANHALGVCAAAVLLVAGGATAWLATEASWVTRALLGLLGAGALALWAEIAVRRFSRRKTDSHQVSEDVQPGA